MSALRHRVRWRAFAAVLRWRLRRCGVSLELDAPAGAAFTAWPRIEPLGHGPSTVRITLGSGVHLGHGCVLNVRCERGGTLSIGSGSRLDDMPRMELRGGTIELGAGVRVRGGAVLKSAGRLAVGDDVLISYGTVVHCDRAVAIGSGVTLAERVTVADSDHDHDRAGEGSHMSRGLHEEPVEIGDNVLVSAGAAVLRGARIGAGSVVAAGAVVRGGEYPPGVLLAGVPAAVKDPRPATS